MGTRSTIAFIDNRTSGGKVISNELVRIYQQYDGYPKGVGLELAHWLKDKKIVNGFGYGETAENGYCNGVGCMSAQFIHDFKVGIGGLYITDHDDCEEYDYKVIVTNDSTITLEVYEDGVHIFQGSVVEFIDAVYNGDFEW